MAHVEVVNGPDMIRTEDAQLRPVTMTKVAIIAALLPILFGTGAGSEAMQHIAAPVVGGMLSVAILSLAVIPAAYLVWKARGLSS